MSNEFNSNKQLLLDLCSVDSRWRCVDNQAFSVLLQKTIFIDPDDGSIQGGEALWGMLQQMREQWAEVDAFLSGFKGPGSEWDALYEIGHDWMLADMTAEGIIKSYTRWKRALLDTPQASGCQDEPLRENEQRRVAPAPQSPTDVALPTEVNDTPKFSIEGSPDKKQDSTQEPDSKLPEPDSTTNPSPSLGIAGVSSSEIEK